MLSKFKFLTYLLALIFFSSCAKNIELEHSEKSKLDSIFGKETAVRQYQLTEDADFLSHFVEAKAAYFRKEFRKASELIELALLIKPNNVELMFHSAELSVALNQNYRALEKLRQILDLQPSFKPAVILTSKIFYSLEDYKSAELFLSKLYDENKLAIEEILFLAQIYKKQKKFKKYEELHHKLILNNSQNPDLLFMLALESFRKKQLKSAESLLLRAIEINPLFTRAIFLLASVYEANGQLAKANFYLISRTPLEKDAALYFRIGSNFFKQERHTDAFDYWTKLAEAIQNEERWFLKILFLVREYDRISQYKKLLRKLVPAKNYKLKNLLAHAFWSNGNKREAIEILSKIKILEDNIESKVLLADFYEKQKKYKSAFRTLAKLERFRKSPKYDSVIYQQASILKSSGKKRKAITLLRKEITNFPQSSQLIYFLGLLLEEEGKWEESIELVKSILKINQKDANAHNFIGYTLIIHSQKFLEARYHLTKAVSIAPDNGYILDSFGWLNYKENKFQEARFYLEKAHQYEPEEVPILEHLALCYYKLKLFSKMKEIIGKLKKIDPAMKKVSPELKTVLALKKLSLSE